MGSYEFAFERSRSGLRRSGANSVSVANDSALDSPETWFPVTIHVMDTGAGTPPPGGDLEIECKDLVGIVGGGNDFEGLYVEASCGARSTPGTVGTVPCKE